MKRAALSVVLAMGPLAFAPPAGCAEPASFATGVARSGYWLGPGDQVKITVFEYDEFTGQQVILPDGTIALPIVGTIVAAERTPDELARELTARLKPYLKNPLVSVGLSQLRPVRINVAGEVQRPGPLQLRSLTGNAPGESPRAPTVSAALLEAGGVTRTADIRKVSLKRFSPDGSARVATLNLWEALWSQEAPRDLELQDGDTLFVPKLTVGDPIDRRLTSRSSLAPRTVRVRVVGEVKKPGEVEVQPDTSISGAVAAAGGPTDKADLGQVTFTRLGEDGQIERQTMNLADFSDAHQIAQGDVVVVPKSSTSAALDIAGYLFAPFAALSQLFNILR